jgi:hypothetical protein
MAVLLKARAGIARSNATRSNYDGAQPPADDQVPAIIIDGAATGSAASRRVLIDSLSIQDLLNERPNTCTFSVTGLAPVEGDTVVIHYGDTDNASTRIFAGTILRVTQTYLAGKPANVVYHVEGIDWSWLLNARLVNAIYTAQDATAIATDLVARFAPPGFTAAGIAAGLPTVDEIRFTNTPFMDALAQLAGRIGGYGACDYFRAVGLWVTPPGAAPPALTPAHPSLREVSYVRDLSQVVTRAIVIGGGSTATIDLAPGATRLPVDDTTWYEITGGLVASGPQRIKYTGLVPAGGGAVIGIGGAPSVAPAAACVAGGTLPAGAYKYAYSWVTAAGETLPSPVVATQTGAITGPSVQASCTPATGGSIPGGQTYTVGWGYSTDPSGATPPADHTNLRNSGVTLGAGDSAIKVSGLKYSGDVRVKAIVLTRSLPALSDVNPYFTGEAVPNDASKPGQSTTATMTKGDAAFPHTPANRPDSAANTTGGNQVQVTGIALGPAGTTARRVYRTAVNGSQLKLLATLNDNTSTALAAPDTAADASLGANAPGTDTSGLNVAVGQVLAGAATIPVTSTAPFVAAGPGWARVGAQLVLYGGTSATALTGVPAAGAGALLTTVAYGTPIAPAPQLTGIPASGAGAIVYAILGGDAVNVCVVQDDLAAQAALASATGGDGIVEGVLEDGRISHEEAISRAAALLVQKSRVAESVRYVTRDPLTKSGAMVSVNLPAPTNLVGSYRIQDVTIDRFTGRNQYPFYTALASSSRFSFEDLIRRQRQDPAQHP